MRLKKQNWSFVSVKPISLEVVRALYIPEHEYRLFPNTYQSKTALVGKLSVRTTIYVLAGVCLYTIGGNELILKPSEFAEIGPGDFTFNVLGQEDVRLVRVVRIPPPFQHD